MPDEQALNTAAPRKCEACGKTIVSTSFIDNDGRLYCSFGHLVEFGELDDVTGKSMPGDPINPVSR